MDNHTLSAVYLKARQNGKVGILMALNWLYSFPFPKDLTVAQIGILRNLLMCENCHQNPFGGTLRPCGHLLCEACYVLTSQTRKCPICNHLVKDIFFINGVYSKLSGERHIEADILVHKVMCFFCELRRKNMVCGFCRHVVACHVCIRNMRHQATLCPNCNSNIVNSWFAIRST